MLHKTKQIHNAIQKVHCLRLHKIWQVYNFSWSWFIAVLILLYIITICVAFWSVKSSFTERFMLRFVRESKTRSRLHIKGLDSSNCSFSCHRILRNMMYRMRVLGGWRNTQLQEIPYTCLAWFVNNSSREGQVRVISFNLPACFLALLYLLFLQWQKA